MTRVKGESSKKGQKRAVSPFKGADIDLQNCVKAEWWREIFNANYLKTDGDVVEDQAITDEEIRLFTQVLGMEKDHTILDLCCGQGRHVLTLARLGYKNLFGLDRSHYLINRARTINKKEALGVLFKEGDARKIPFPVDHFDFVYLAGNSFGYFESREDDLKTLAEILRVLKPGAKLLIDLADGTFIRKNFQPRSWEWIGDFHFVCRERKLSDDGERLISREVISHVNKGVIADQFYAERLYRPESIAALLKRASFSEISFHGEHITQSQRNQDLGMMAQRIIVTAEVRKQWTVKQPVAKEQNVVVIMGDPKRGDRVKPNAVFDEDDFQTIERMKVALGSLKGYRFQYFDNHELLMHKLQISKPQIDWVFNLCDEGYFNDPRKELHVAALLDVLGIPYTGGSPKCLAYCYDKSLVRGIARELEIPVPGGMIIKPDDVRKINMMIDFPVIVKPNFGDSSFGISQSSVCNNIEELENAIKAVHLAYGYDSHVLLEEFLTGKDISVGIIGNPPESYQVLPIIEEDYSALPDGLPQICGYEAKWDPTSPYWKVCSRPTDLPEETQNFLRSACISLFNRLDCRDYARFDWRLDDSGTPRLLEVNPNPGWCWDGHLARMAEFGGTSYAEMLGRILQEAEKRFAGDRLAENAASIELGTVATSQT